MENKYSLSRKISTDISSLSNYYKIINNDNGVNIKLTFEKHLPERLIERNIEYIVFHRILEKMVRYKLCEAIYAHEVSGLTHTRVSFKYRDYLLAVTVKKTLNNNYLFKLSTFFLERKRTQGRTIKTFMIDLT